MSVSISIAYQGSLRTEACHGPSQVQISTDAPVDNGGLGRSFSPTDLVATALGSCILTIMGLTAKRHELDLTGARVQVTKEMQASPRRIAKLTVDLSLPEGLELSDQERVMLERSALACPVHRSLHPDVEVEIRIDGELLEH